MEIKFIDGMIRIADADDAVRYLDNIAAFEKDFNTTLPPLPDGMASFTYFKEERIMVYYDAKQNAFPQEGSFYWPLSDEIAAAVPSACARQVTRKAEELAEILAKRGAPVNIEVKQVG